MITNCCVSSIPGALDPVGAKMENDLLQLLPLIHTTAIEVEKMMESQRKVGDATRRKYSSTTEPVNP